MSRVLLTIACLFALLTPANAQLSKSELDRVGIDIGDKARLPLGMELETADGQKTTIGRQLGGKPAVLVFADFTCRTLCGATVAMASAALAQSGLGAGKDYRLLVVGIDPKDSLADARRMRDENIDSGSVERETAFLLGDDEAVEAMTSAAGYSYVYDEKADQFAHPTAAFVVTPDGRIAEVLTAIGLSGETVRLALVSAAQERIGSFSDYVRLLCYCYDPATGKYSGVILGTLQVLGFATVAALALLILLLVRGDGASGGSAA